MAGYIVDGVQLTQEQAERIAAEVEVRKSSFKTGDWVVDLKHDHGVMLVKSVNDSTSVFPGFYRTKSGLFRPSELRRATPEEIAAAKVIEVRDGLIVRGKNAGKVWQWSQYRQHWRCLSDNELKPALQLWALDTDHYTVLDSYTIEGAK